jgi:repressor of nif and glnA expression
MISPQNTDVERKTAAILKVLSYSPSPIGGRVLARRLGELGIDLGERAVRYRLKVMDEKGLTRTVGRKDGRSITESGIEELSSALVSDRVGLVITKIGRLAYQSTFNPAERRGEVPVNVSLFPRKDFRRAVGLIKETFVAGYGIHDLVAIASEGERIGEVLVPAGRVGLATVSHVVVYGSLLRAGIPVESKFGGILQIRDNKALRFADLIEYAGCSMDPTEVFLAGKMTSVSKVAETGNGEILATFCEIPTAARSDTRAIIEKLEMAGMKGLVIIENMGEPVCQAPVRVDRVGMVFVDGINPVATVVEAGKDVTNYTMNCTIDYSELKSLLSCKTLEE